MGIVLAEGFHNFDAVSLTRRRCCDVADRLFCLLTANLVAILLSNRAELKQATEYSNMDQQFHST